MRDAHDAYAEGEETKQIVLKKNQRDLSNYVLNKASHPTSSYRKLCRMNS